MLGLAHGIRTTSPPFDLLWAFRVRGVGGRHPRGPGFLCIVHYTSKISASHHVGGGRREWSLKWKYIILDRRRSEVGILPGPHSFSKRFTQCITGSMCTVSSSITSTRFITLSPQKAPPFTRPIPVVCLQVRHPSHH